MSLSKNDNIVLCVDGYTAQGGGIGHYEGMAVFVSGAAAGDTVEAHIIKVKSNYAVAVVSKILEPSPDRIENSCPSFPRCGGCCFRHISYEAETKAKKSRVEEAFKRIGRMSLSVESFMPAAEQDGYRNKAQLPVGVDSNGNVIVGFFSPRSHRVIPCHNCLLQPDEFGKAVSAFLKWANDNHISVYDESTGQGILRHLYLRKAPATGEIMVCPVINCDELPCAEKLVDSLIESIPEIKSICVNINKSDTNVVLGTKSKVLYGRSYIEDVLCGVKVRLSVLSFYQVNREQAQILYRKAAEFAQLSGRETLLDLYCGTGTIGLSMAADVKTLVGVEEIPQAVEDARLNAEMNGAGNARFICADAAAAAIQLESDGLKPDVIILDPPRKGCSPELIDTVASMGASRIVYVSCDPATLARDAKLFTGLGYAVHRLAAVDMFPRTCHVEAVCLFVHDGEA